MDSTCSRQKIAQKGSQKCLRIVANNEFFHWNQATILFSIHLVNRYFTAISCGIFSAVRITCGSYFLFFFPLGDKMNSTMILKKFDNIQIFSSWIRIRKNIKKYHELMNKQFQLWGYFILGDWISWKELRSKFTRFWTNSFLNSKG